MAMHAGKRSLAGLGAAAVAGLLSLAALVPPAGAAAAAAPASESAPPPAGPTRSWFTPPANPYGSTFGWVYGYKDPHEERSDVLVPIASFILPGFGQWINGEYTSAAVYSGAAIAGYTYAGNIYASDHLRAAASLNSQRASKYDKSSNDPNALDQKSIGERKNTLGGLIAQGSGGISAYHSFRTAAVTRREHGQYEFLGRDETPMELYADAFHFEYLKRTTTWAPLLIGAAIAYLQVRSPLPSDMVSSNYTAADGFFTGAYSYNAGTHEEALFRGWIMPATREYTGSDLWSNAIQAVLFAAAHLNTNSTPLPQLLLGFDLGYISQKNGWEIGEGVFIHTWWDIMAFWAQYQSTWKYANTPLATHVRPVLWLPPLTYEF